ncbi:MAG: hypothetical protein GC152_09015 [Alphaproteobacteria bacterium]|nr:hypothetical protein [Alphaproteobacteria bacterium]
MPSAATAKRTSGGMIAAYLTRYAPTGPDAAPDCPVGERDASVRSSALPLSLLSGDAGIEDPSEHAVAEGLSSDPRLDANAASADRAAVLKAAAASLLDASHRLRTPVNAIVGFASMIEDAETYGVDAGKCSAYAAYIAQSTDVLVRHFDLLFETAAFDAATVAPVTQKIDLAELVGAAASRVDRAAQAAGVTVADRTTAAEAAAVGDPDLSASAIEHLLRAAIERSPEGGEILVRAAMAGEGRVGVSVRDFGSAMQTDAVDDALSIAVSPELGLGRMLRGAGGGPPGAIAMARRLVELQGGAIALKSREGRGLLVQLDWPMA